MTQCIRAIYENGVFKPLDDFEFPEHRHVRLTVESLETEIGNGNSAGEPSVDDPLAGLRVATGISDLAERFDDYRFGRQKQ